MSFTAECGRMKLSPVILCALSLAVLAGCKTRLPKAEPTTAAAPVVQGFCPTIMLRDGTASYTVYAQGADGDPTKVAYQASLANTTRSCVRSKTSLTIKTMVQGRLVTGPMGKAQKVTLPIRVVVVDGGKVIYSELKRFPVNLTDPAQPRQFVFSKEATVPGGISSSSRVYIGFDTGPAQE